MDMKISSAALPLDAAAQAERQKMSKLADGAQQFEAMLLQQMLKPLQFGAAAGADESEEAGGASETIRGMGTEAVSHAIAKAGGFGVAKQIIRQVTAEHEASELKQHSTKV